MQQLSEQILTDIKQWRHAHPKGTSREIEDDAHRRMSQLEAQVIQEAAQQSEQRAWSGTPPEKRPLCPVCGIPLQACGKRTRRLQGGRGARDQPDKKVHPRVEPDFFSLDKELALPKESYLTSRQHEHLVHLFSWMPFE